MTMHDDLLATHPDLREIKNEFGPPPPPPGRSARRAAWIVVIAAVAVLAIGGGMWWIADSRVPVSDYDEVVAELDDARSDLTAAERSAGEELAELSDQISGLNLEISELKADTESLRQQLAYSRHRVDALTGTNNDLRGRMNSASSLVEILLYWELTMPPEVYAQLTDAGVDLTPFDEVLGRLGHDETTVEEWVESGDAWFNLNGAVHATRDDELIAAWVTFNDAPVGSEEEAIALSTFWLRLEILLYENVTGPENGVPADGGQVAVSTEG